MGLLLLAGKLGVNAAAAGTIISVITKGSNVVWAVGVALALITGGAAAIAELGVAGLVAEIEKKLVLIGVARTTIW